jgi:hypothetical protein
MKKSKALAEDLRFMVPFDPQALPRVKWSKTFFQLAQNFFVHQSRPLNRLRRKP